MKSVIDFSANGKLLLTAEYLVLAGARSLAFPVCFGQKMMVTESETKRVISWVSASPAGTWFQCAMRTEDFYLLSTSDIAISQSLREILLAAQGLNPAFLSKHSGYNVEITANYPLTWGLGSSSTLISLIAAWAAVDPFQLFRKNSNGSGYDIACAARKGLIYYQLKNHVPLIQPAKPGNALGSSSWFVYLGKKQNSSAEVSRFQRDRNFTFRDLDEASDLSVRICECDSASELIKLVNQHEALVGKIVDRPPLMARYPSFEGSAKSLGAWGGDFAMFVSSREPDEVRQQLKNLGFSIIFSFNDLIIKS